MGLNREQTLGDSYNSSRKERLAVRLEKDQEYWVDTAGLLVAATHAACHRKSDEDKDEELRPPRKTRPPV